MSRARTLSKLFNTDGNLNLSPVASINSEQVGGRRNILFNGDMRVWQRGTSFSTGTSQTYTCDRWSTAVGSAFNYDATITRETDVPTGSGFKYCTKIAVDTAQTPTSTQNGGFHQKLEQGDLVKLAFGTSSAKKLSLSFWVKSNKTGTYTIQLQQNSGSGGTGNYFLKEYTINSSATWEYKTLTFDGNTSQAFDVTSDVNDGLRVIWWHTVGSDDHGTLDAWTASASYLASSNQVNLFETSGNYWQITGAQFEIGENSTDFEYRTYGEELRLCQRYYAQLNSSVASNSGLGTGHATDSTSTIVDVFPPVVPMRATASGSLSATSTFTINTAAISAEPSARGISTISDRHMRIDFTATADANTTHGSRLVRFKGASGSIAWDADL